MKELPTRKNNRLTNYDYSMEGCYFITICVRDKQQILARIAVGDAALGAPIIGLTKTGEIVKKYIENINKVYVFAHLDTYVIMPNHIHFLISLTKGTPKAASPTKSAVPQIVNALKSLSSKEYGETLWQRGYYDHIIRDEADYLIKWNYIETNPAKWLDDKYYSNE